MYCCLNKLAQWLSLWSSASSPQHTLLWHCAFPLFCLCSQSLPLPLLHWFSEEKTCNYRNHRQQKGFWYMPQFNCVSGFKFGRSQRPVEGYNFLCENVIQSRLNKTLGQALCEREMNHVVSSLCLRLFQGSRWTFWCSSLSYWFWVVLLLWDKPGNSSSTSSSLPWCDNTWLFNNQISLCCSTVLLWTSLAAMMERVVEFS